MRIRRLRVAGFKSFVEPAELVIEPGLTGVVGPNGCGKSNLLEAIRWVMGEGSPKSLRGGAMDDVIFAGTASRPARDFAEVSMLVEDTGGDEVEVVRRIERGAGSAYRIAGRDVRARDVALLFADAATGAHSPALVSQGRIGAVIAARPAERRAMLEEAAGIAGLHVRRRDAEQRLRATEANLQRLDETVAEVGTRAAALRRQARAAERYRALSEQIRAAEARLVFARWREAAAAADTARAVAARAETATTAAAEVQQATAAAQSAATDAMTVARTAAGTTRDAAIAVEHRLAAQQAERAAAARRIEELAAATTRAATERGREEAVAGNAAAALARLKDEQAALGAQVTADAARLPGLGVRVAEAEQAGREAETALAEGLAQAAAESAELRVADAALAAARGRAERTSREHDTIRGEIARLADPVPLAAERDAHAAGRRAAADDLADAEQARVQAEATTAQAQQARDRAQTARAAVRAEWSALDGEAAALRKANRGDGRDRLLDRLGVDAGYEQALAAALGEDLDAGLEAGAARRWTGAAPLPGDPPLPSGEPLAAHVAGPPELARRLAQVVVVESDDGGPLAVGQRLVTREGRLRRWDGFVAEGGGAAAAARLVRVNRLAALDERLPSLAATLAAADAALADADAAIVRARADGQAAATRLARAEAAGREAARGEDRAAAALERLAVQQDDLARRGARIETEAAGAAAELARAEQARAALPDGAAGRAHAAALRQRVEASRASLAEARAGHASLGRALATARERLAAVGAEAAGWRARADEGRRRLADLDQRAGDLAIDAAASAGRLAEIDGALAVLIPEQDAARAAADEAAAAERAAATLLHRAEAEARAAGERLAAAREARAGTVARAEGLDQRRAEASRLSGERFGCPAPVLLERVGFVGAEVAAPEEEGPRHDRLAAERERLGPVNLVAADELAALEAGAAATLADREELGVAVARLRGSIGHLNREGSQRLLAAFETVDAHFRRLFATLFEGGQAHLALVESDDPLEAGLEIMAQPPGKRLQSLTLLSGGEQALTAAALIFALFLTNPAPICVLDEVDAALDDANIDRFCGLLDRMAADTDTRYLVVTHNAVTMARMHRLFGVTMIERGVSRLVSVDLGGATALAAE